MMITQNPKIYYQMACEFDRAGKETQAIEPYKKAIKYGLKGQALQQAYLGLGSTLRCLGRYKESQKVLSQAVKKFPQNQALKVFYAMTLFNLKKNQKSSEILLNLLLETSKDQSIKKYSRAIKYYSNKLDKKFN